MAQHVVVIGAGIVGAATAVELLRDGHRVTIVEPGDPGGEQAASYGNGTCSIRVRSFRCPRRGYGRRCRAIWPIHSGRWQSAGPICRVCCHGCGASSAPARPRRKVAATARALRRDCRRAGEASSPGGRSRRRRTDHPQGRIVRVPQPRRFRCGRAVVADAAREWRALARTVEEELRQREPTLDRHYKFALLVEENGQCRDPGAYVNALVQHAWRWARRIGALG